jgi:hypothetical protein
LCVILHHMFYGAVRHWGWPYLLGGKNSFLVHIPHVSVTVLNYTRFDCMPRFVTEIVFQWRIMHICENTDIMFILPAYNTFDSAEITKKMQPCNRIYYSTVH